MMWPCFAGNPIPW